MKIQTHTIPPQIPQDGGNVNSQQQPAVWGFRKNPNNNPIPHGTIKYIEALANKRNDRNIEENYGLSKYNYERD